MDVYFFVLFSVRANRRTGCVRVTRNGDDGMANKGRPEREDCIIETVVDERLLYVRACSAVVSDRFCRHDVYTYTRVSATKADGGGRPTSKSGKGGRISPRVLWTKAFSLSVPPSFRHCFSVRRACGSNLLFGGPTAYARNRPSHFHRLYIYIYTRASARTRPCVCVC